MRDHRTPITDKPDCILRLPAVLGRTGLSRSTLYRKIKAGTFPKQVAISDRCTGWRESDIAEWMSNPYVFGTGADARELG